MPICAGVICTPANDAELAASRAGCCTSRRMPATTRATASREYSTSSSRSVSSVRPVRSRSERVRKFPSRLSAIADWSRASTFVCTSMSAGSMVKLRWRCVICSGWSRRWATSLRTAACASAIVIPPTSTPATLIPSAIWSEREVS